ncbi:lipoprotein [Spiroplasma taiwanense]|uniref:Lipoprotein n=1 Tax=Spiroplasma taiwanense CT-1 TaxID=1276220 RepID=S5MBL2_9MOLU|nr:lipoprotein [Spiroplasma taiwanense]AGR41163.1 hypothetical protein STAIW_v1c05380 [Spiroplasma taiwanense CT-1]
MKKILTFLSVFGMVTTTSTTVISCKTENSIENTINNLQKALNKIAIAKEEEAIEAIKSTSKGIENVIMDESTLPSKSFEILFLNAEKENDDSHDELKFSNLNQKAGHAHIHYIITYKKAELLSTTKTEFGWSSDSFNFEVELHVG